MLLKLLPPQKTRKGRTLLQRRRGSFVAVFFMFHKTPQQVLATYQPHFGINIVNTTIEINMLAKLK
jgi:hypothetical protein